MVAEVTLDELSKQWVIKMNLICDKQIQRSIIQSSISIGSLLGLIVMNIVSDIKGRKYALLADLYLGIASAVITYLGAVIQSTVLLIFSSILSGFSGYSLIIISYIMLGDICQESMRQKYSVYLNIFNSIGLCLFFIIKKWLNQWYIILVFFMIIPLIFFAILSNFMIQQSPNFCLFQQKNPQACVNTLINIAKINKKSYVEVQKIKYIVDKISKKMQKDEKRLMKQANIFTTITKWKYLKIILCMAIVESGGNLCFYGIQYAINDIGYIFGINNLVLGVTEIFTTLVVGKYVTDMPRKKTLAIMYCSTPLITLLFFSDLIVNSPFLCTVILFVIRIMTTTGYCMIVMIQTQSFPLQIQSIGAGSIQAFAQLGSIIAPILTLFSINHSLPKISVIGITMLICTIALIFVPESSSISLRPDSKQDNGRQIKSQAPRYRNLK